MFPILHSQVLSFPVQLPVLVAFCFHVRTDFSAAPITESQCGALAVCSLRPQEEPTFFFCENSVSPRASDST